MSYIYSTIIICLYLTIALHVYELSVVPSKFASLLWPIVVVMYLLGTYFLYRELKEHE